MRSERNRPSTKRTILVVRRDSLFPHAAHHNDCISVHPFISAEALHTLTPRYPGSAVSARCSSFCFWSIPPLSSLLPSRFASTLQHFDMPWFIPFLLLVAAAWAVVGILLAKWLKQAGHSKPLKSRHLDDREIYGGGVGFGRDVGLGGAERDLGAMGRGGEGERLVGLGSYGKGRVKGL